MILCGDLVEHLTEPGRMLAQVRLLMREHTELLLSTPNSLGLPNLLRYALGKAVDGDDHVLSFNVFTLQNLLRRYDFFIDELFACYDAPPRDRSERLLRTLGTPVLKLWPRFGGTLLVSARRTQSRKGERDEKLPNRLSAHLTDERKPPVEDLSPSRRMSQVW